MNILNIIKEESKLTNDFYDLIRVVDPKNNAVIYEGKDSGCVKCACYEIWQKDTPCSNCISHRALKENNTFVKIEQANGKIYLAASTIVKCGGDNYVFEMIKDITGKRGEDLKRDTTLKNVNRLINKMNNTLSLE
jgi:two-component system cell cycle response regulator